eukprot:6175364-Pleurochrysis_carterae.AAC.1
MKPVSDLACKPAVYAELCRQARARGCVAPGCLRACVRAHAMCEHVLVRLSMSAYNQRARACACAWASACGRVRARASESQPWEHARSTRDCARARLCERARAR